jgi:hypothetical protein
MRISHLLAGACGGALAFSATAASAAIVSFDGENPGSQTNYVEDGFVFDTVDLANGNCESDGTRPCMQVSDGETVTITREGGGSFSLSSFWFQLIGAGNVNTLTVIADGVSVLFPATTFGNNDGGQDADLTSNAAFADITTLMFTKSGGGSVRIDDLNLTAIPVPGALPLMLTALGAGGFLARRRKKRVQAA